MIDMARLIPFWLASPIQRSAQLGRTADTSGVSLGESETVLPHRGQSSAPRRFFTRLALIPTLLAITWIVVAIIRFDQSSDPTGAGAAGFWATPTLSFLAVLYLVYAAI